MSVRKLQEYLDSQNIRYITITHSVAYTAQGTASVAHIPGKELAKTVIVKVNEDLVMAVLPASFQINLNAFSKWARSEDVRLAREDEFRNRFPDCELGAMPPFGNLYGMAVYVDETLTKDKEIAFNAGSHRELIRMAYEDFDRLVQPTILNFALRHSASAA
jgi:Ala-tRNA(Pro) deacylase